MLPFDDEDELQQPYSGTPEQRALMEKSLRQRYADASNSDEVQDAQRRAQIGNILAAGAQGFGDMVTARSVARGGPGMRDITSGVRQAGAQRVSDAQQNRKNQIEGVLEDDRLGQLEKDRARQEVDRGFQDKERANAEKGWARDDEDHAFQNKERAQKEKGWEVDNAFNDPNSAQSKAIRDQYARTFPDIAKTPGFENLSANDIKEGLADPLKFRESIEARKEEAAQRSADRQATLAAAAGARADSREARREEKADERAWKEEQKEKENTEKKKGVLNEIEDRRTNITQNLDILDKMIADKGTWEATGSHNQDMDRLVDQIATDMAKLSDPSSVARPSEVEQVKANLIRSGFGNSNTTAREILKNFRSEVERRADNAYSIRGMQKPQRSPGGTGGMGGTVGGSFHGKDLP